MSTHTYICMCSTESFWQDVKGPHLFGKLTWIGGKEKNPSGVESLGKISLDRESWGLAGEHEVKPGRARAGEEKQGLKRVLRPTTSFLIHLPFSPRFFRDRSMWSLSWMRTCRSVGWSRMKGNFSSCSVGGRLR